MEDRNPGTTIDETKIPSFTEVRSFFADEYNFYSKWIAVKEPNWDELIGEAKVLEVKHPYRYALDRIVSTTCLIESVYMASHSVSNKEEVSNDNDTNQP